MIAAAGAALISDRPDIHNVARADGESTLSRPPTALSGTTATSMSQMPERTTQAAVPDTLTYSATTRKLERMHSGRRREHTHHHSHSSRHSKDEQKKSVLDYSMHVLFTAVGIALTDGHGGDANMQNASLLPKPRKSLISALPYPSIPNRTWSKYVDQAQMQCLTSPSMRSRISPVRSRSR
jgi:hypothetical protein